jgi:prepilin-type N-terminal cleavage/methylation domain-containing protein/prepilin-type processing-associated H-X9-DG protein
MNMAHLVREDARPRDGGQSAAFTLIELLVVIALVAVLAAMLLPAISKAKVRSQGVACLNNNRQLATAWLLYADDHNDRLAYNLGGPDRKSVAQRTNLNWVNNILNWSLHSDNTNTATITDASLGAYANRVVSIYRCPSDNVLGLIQRRAGWSARVRSYSMNAMIGDAGELSQQGFNSNNPDYVQFFKLSSIPRPASIFVFLDEHPDSINDGYFLNKAEYREWVDLPASYHDGAATFSFADGHSQLRRWQYARTKRPARPDAAKLPLYVPRSEIADFNWVVEHMSIDRH